MIVMRWEADWWERKCCVVVGIFSSNLAWPVACTKAFAAHHQQASTKCPSILMQLEDCTPAVVPTAALHPPPPLHNGIILLLPS